MNFAQVAYETAQDLVRLHSQVENNEDLVEYIFYRHGLPYGIMSNSEIEYIFSLANEFMGV